MAGRLTFKRLLNLFLVKISLKLKLPKVIGYPTTLFIEPTNICNLKCPLCPTGNGTLKKKKGMMKLKDFKKLMDEAGKYLLSITLWNYGEPFINKKTIDMIKHAKKYNIRLVASTNGYGFERKEDIKKIVESGLDRLIVALDGADQKTLSIYRVNADFDVLINGMKELIRIKNELKTDLPRVELQFLIMKHNEHQIEKIKRLAKECDVDLLVLKTVNTYGDDKLGKKFVPKNKKYIRKIRNKTIKNECDGIWFGANVNWDGNLVPCCYDPYEKLLMGNAFKSGLKNVWNSRKFVALRKQILRNKKQIPVCANCPTNTESEDYARIKFKS